LAFPISFVIPLPPLLQNIDHQREVIGTLEQGGHDATAAMADGS
jgi:hypothetical protein